MDVQRYRDDSMLWLYVSDIVYFIPGWRASPGCLAEEARAKEIGVPCIYEEDPPRCIVSSWVQRQLRVYPVTWERVVVFRGRHPGLHSASWASTKGIRSGPVYCGRIR